MSRIKEFLNTRPWAPWALFIGSMVVVFILGILASSIMERRSEALIAYAPTKKVKDFEPRNEKWGEIYPREYLSFLQTSKTDFKSKYNGNGHKDLLKDDPNLVILWAGYGFSKGYNAPKGHYYAIDDLREIYRTGAPTGPNDGPMPSTCWTCKSPDVPRIMNKVGTANFYKGKWSSRGHQIVNPIGCADCHDPKTMDLKITRPALVEAFERMGKDITMASHQEKRSLVCAQCHVEYYFKGKGKYLTFPWDKGLNAEDMEKYYDEANFKDWTHKLSKAPMLKAQHPGYELFQHGIHAKRGVSCADCHMPYVTEGGVKHSSHQLQSPLNNMNQACQTCHRESEDELRKNVYSKQDKVYELRMIAEKHLVKAHLEAQVAWDKGANQKEMDPILKLIRHAQWRWDYAIASHGGSFHAALEASRILGTAIQKSLEARRLLSKVLSHYGVKGEIDYPDVSTKEKAQKYIGLGAKKMYDEKQRFLKTLVPVWDKKASERDQCYDKEDMTIMDCSED
jgi:nitrite reductase (cytochrome c-552)